ncbi:MAG: hypothetical protein SF187_10035 [Deltaproteobacteria bacterium]|nr:hypothetical protein [Deltaproteobacteria bacterium]
MTTQSKSKFAVLLLALGAYSGLLGAGCDDDDSKRLPDANFDAAGGSQDAAPADAPLNGGLDANTTGADARVDAAVAFGDAGEGSADAAFIEPNVDAGAGCQLVSTQHTSAAQAGLPGAGLALWLRADQGVYKDQNNGVCAWVDHGGAGHALLSAANQRPVFVAGAGNVLPSIQFTGGGKSLSIAGVLGIAPQSGRTYIAVQKLVNTTSRLQAIIQGQSGTPGTYVSIDSNPFQTVGSREGVYVTNNAYDSDVATSTELRVHAFVVNPMVIGSAILPATSYRINGTVATLTRTPGGLGNTNFENFSGANFTAVGVGQSGSDYSLREILIYDHALSAQEIAQVEAALFARYGIGR